MRTAFEHGYRLARRGDPWRKAPPILAQPPDGREDLTALGIGARPMRAALAGDAP